MIKNKVQKIKTTKQDISDYWKEHLENGAVNVSYSRSTTHCWRCGVKKRLDRCHIVPHAQGGEDTPGNFVLLCKHCHIDNPNLSNIEIIWKWLSAYKMGEDQLFWYVQGEREYEYIYNTTVDIELHKKGYNTRDKFNVVFKETIKEAGHHFGQPRRNRATVAGIIAISLGKMEDDTDRF